jgi:hypothetical protein
MSKASSELPDLDRTRIRKGGTILIDTRIAAAVLPVAPVESWSACRCIRRIDGLTDGARGDGHEAGQ